MRTRGGFGGMVLGLAALALLVGGAAARADVIRVSQESSPGAGDFNDHVLGFLAPFSTSLTASGYYDYNTVNPVSYGNNPPALTVNTSHLFFVNASDGLSLFVVHDKPAVSNGGGSAKTRFDLSGGTANILVEDDPPPTDTYTSTGTLFTAMQSWTSPHTDGLVIGALPADFTLLAQFTSPPTGLENGWVAISAGGTTIPLALVPGERVRLDVVPSATIPEPSALALFALGGLGLAGWRRWRKRTA